MENVEDNLGLTSSRKDKLQRTAKKLGSKALGRGGEAIGLIQEEGVRMFKQIQGSRMQAADRAGVEKNGNWPNRL